MFVCRKNQSSYIAGCRCDGCREAHRVYALRYRRQCSTRPTGYIPVERVLPLVDFLEREYGSLAAAERAAGFAGTSRFSHWRQHRYRLVQKASAEKLATFVLAHRRRVPLEPWATFDSDRPRPPTPWERERAEKYATDDLHSRDRANTRRKRERDRVGTATGASRGALAKEGV